MEIEFFLSRATPEPDGPRWQSIMDIPHSWHKAKQDIQHPDGRRFPIAVWGWGSSEDDARSVAAERLKRVADRIRRGEPFPDAYEYATRTIREEILQTIEGDDPDSPDGIITRNRYGAEVMNTSTLLFLDVDLKPPTLGFKLKRLLGRTSGTADEAALQELRSALKAYGRASFRIYRTAGGFRAIAFDRSFDPAGSETRDLMQATKTDPAYQRLCTAQKCFRARLTPKPWRCNAKVPTVDYPRSREEADKFDAWKSSYETAARDYATCRYLETLGRGRARSDLSKLIEIHDKITRCNDDLPLA